MKIEVVIGANYGDEGKGLFTEHLCRNRPAPLVVLSNGGCQRGHTVNNVEKGIRHVFHHFGSGTLLGVPSVYSKTYLLNPIKYIEEKQELEKVGIKPVSFRAPGCILQLPSDMLVNQALENHRARSGSKHGSCGWGIWETLVRNKEMSKMTFEDFAWMGYAKKRAKILESLEWQIENRLTGVDRTSYEELLGYVSDEKFTQHFIADFEAMEESTKLIDSDDLLDVDWGIHWQRDVETLVVENAQGLLLDKEYAPVDSNGKTDVHATPSSTGLAGAVDAIGECINFKNVTANYISRTYFTRHGDGPFPEEDSGLSFVDNTNAPNEWQGTMRFGSMEEDDVDALLARANKDCSRFSDSICKKFAITHCNEMKPIDSLQKIATYFSYEDDSSKMIEEKT